MVETTMDIEHVEIDKKDTKDFTELSISREIN